MSISVRVFRSGSTFLIVYYSCHWLNSTYRIGIMDLWFYVTYYSVFLITWFESFCMQQISNMIIVNMWTGILYMSCMSSYEINHRTWFTHFYQNSHMFKYCCWGIIIIFCWNEGNYCICTLLIKVIPCVCVSSQQTV